jgi:hypothetical protein
MRYSLDITRIPVIKPADFEKQNEIFNESNDFLSLEPGDQMIMWLDGILRHLQSGGNVTVADLRRAAGLEVEPLDEFFGWNNSISLQLKVDEDHTIKFPLLHLRRLTPPIYPEELNWQAFDTFRREGKVIDNFDYYNEFISDMQNVHKLTYHQTQQFIAGEPYWEAESND